jgi:hypothetical protein
LIENEIAQNARAGIRLEHVMHVVATGNAVRANGAGGISLTKVADLDLQANAISENMQFGVMASESMNLSARRNFWGMVEGPAGGFSGQGNAVLGLDPTQLIPWLPAAPDQIQPASVAGKLIVDSGGDRVQLDAHETTGIELELRELRQVGQDQIRAPALISLGRYTHVPASVQTMPDGIGYYHVLVRGFDSGVADFTIYYDEAALSSQGSDSPLRVFSYLHGKWTPLATNPQPHLGRVVAEAPLTQLEGVLVLAPEPAPTLTSLSVPGRLESRADENPKTESGAQALYAARSGGSQVALAETQIPLALAPLQSGPDYWGIVFLFITIFLAWTAIRLYRASEKKLADECNRSHISPQNSVLG